MLPGTRIRVAKPSQSHRNLLSKEGKIITLLPIACNPLRYKCSFPDTDTEKDDGGIIEVEFPSTAVHALDYSEDDDSDEEESCAPQMSVVNGLCYCRDHRMESCGKCGFEFLESNLIKELGGDVDMGLSFAEQLRRIGAPTRRAPSKNLVVKPFDLYVPEMNDAVIGIPNGLDVVSLDDFPRDKPLRNAFESQFLISMKPQQSEPITARPLNQVRHMFASVGKYLDDAIQTNAALPRLFLQDPAQSEVLNMDIVAIKVLVGEHSLGMKWRLPIVVVGWSRIRSGDIAALQASLSFMAKGTPMVEIQALPHEMELFAKIIKANADRISVEAKTFLQRTALKDDPSIQIGVVAPICTAASEQYYQCLGNYCDFCTATGCKLAKCSRCKTVQYCCRACQKAAWKEHKRHCKKVE